MEWLTSAGIPPAYQGLATLVFVVVAGALAAWSQRFGQKQGPVQANVQEFGFAGQLADMGPIKELIEQTGLLVQQQIRTAVVLERIALAYEGQIAADRAEQEIEEEVERRLAIKAAEDARRPPTRKPPA